MGTLSPSVSVVTVVAAPPRASTRERLDLLWLGVAAVVLRLPAFFSQQPVHPDDGFYGAAVVAMRDGGVPYREVFSSQGPLHLPLLYVGDLLGLRTFDAPRVTPVIAGVAATLLTYLIGRRLTTRAGALLAAIVVATSGSVLFVTSGITSDGPTLAFALGAFFAALRYRERPSVGRIVAVALLLDGAVLVKPALGFLAGLASIYLALRVGRVRELVIGAASAIVAALVVAAPFGLGRVWDQTVAYQLGSHREQSMLLNARKIVTTMWDRDPILLALALLTVAAAIWMPRRRDGDDRDPERALWLWTVVSLLFLVAEPALWRNHLSSVIAPLALVIALRPPPWRWVVIAAIVVVPLQASHLRGFFWPSPYRGVTAQAHDALESLPPGAWALSDDVGLLWRAHTRPTDDLVDTSIKRQEQGDVDGPHVAEEATNPHVCAVLVWSHKYWGSFEDLPGLLAREGYQPTQRFPGQAGDRVLYTRPCPTLDSAASESERDHGRARRRRPVYASRGRRPSMSSARNGATLRITALNETNSDATFRASTTASVVYRTASPQPSTTASPSTPPSTFAPVSPSMRCSRRSSPSSATATPITGATDTPTAPPPSTSASGT
jgi:hypothetical protein